jgi:hypothetical protein
MERYRPGRRLDDGRRRRYWPRARAAGCLLWIVLLVVLLIVLSVMFGGFQKGTQYKGLGSGPGSAASASAAAASAPAAAVGGPGQAWNQGLSGPRR